MSIDFHRLMEPIDINRLIFIDYIDYIDWFPMSDFHRLDTSGVAGSGRNKKNYTKKSAKRRKPTRKGAGARFKRQRKQENWTRCPFPPPHHI